MQQQTTAQWTRVQLFQRSKSIFHTQTDSSNNCGGRAQDHRTLWAWVKPQSSRMTMERVRAVESECNFVWLLLTFAVPTGVPAKSSNLTCLREFPTRRQQVNAQFLLFLLALAGIEDDICHLTASLFPLELDATPDTLNPILMLIQKYYTMTNGVFHDGTVTLKWQCNESDIISYWDVTKKCDNRKRFPYFSIKPS